MASATESTHKPYVSDSARMPEFTLPALLLGTSLGLIFAASSLYLVLKVGMTVSASIPVAVLAITLFRALSQTFGLRRATILENNIVQTSGSAGESIAFGVGVTMPALLMLGFEMDLPRVMIVSVLGGILGILAMIPLRPAFIVRMHGRPGEPGTLLYPEGVAAAQVLISGERGGTTGATVFVGFGIAFVHKFLTIGFNALRETVQVPITAINRAAVFAADMASELLGVGYIIGMRTASIMMAGAVLGYLVIIPIIYFVGEHAPVVIPPSSEKIIKDMTLSEIRNNYLLFIGAGCVATAGLISMARTLPIIIRSARAGMASVGVGRGAEDGIRRMDNDMSMNVVLFGSLGLLVLLAAFLVTEVGLVGAILGALLVLLFGFLFVTVSSRLTGEIGSSSNPISGMTTATLMVTCLIFLGLGMTTPRDRVLALSVAAVVCIAASNGGTTAQSLKTGFLVGGTPKAMQYAILFGALVSALVIGGTLLAFNAAGTVYSDEPEYLPLAVKKATVDPIPSGVLKKIEKKERYEGSEYKVVSNQALESSKKTKSDTKAILLVSPESGKVAFIKEAVVLTPEERSKLQEKEVYEGKEYLIWDTRRELFTKQAKDRREVIKVPEGTAPEGRFLVDPASGRVAFIKDPTIGGIIEEHNGTKTTRFPAPKTKIMQIIIDGVLTLKLNWSLVLIGALIAVTLELCGVSSLAFAVGLYVPIQYSVPIFIGGMVRWAVDRYQSAQAEASMAAAGNDPEARAFAEVEAIRKSETSPGVLLASGYIAGGSLAGVVVAFLEFAPALKESLNLEEVVTSMGETLSSLVSMAVFSLLVAFALIVGLGLLFKPPEEEPTPTGLPPSSNGPDTRFQAEETGFRNKQGE